MLGSTQQRRTGGAPPCFARWRGGWRVQSLLRDEDRPMGVDLHLEWLQRLQRMLRPTTDCKGTLGYGGGRCIYPPTPVVSRGVLPVRTYLHLLSLVCPKCAVRAMPIPGTYEVFKVLSIYYHLLPSYLHICTSYILTRKKERKKTDNPREGWSRVRYFRAGVRGANLNGRPEAF